MKRLCCGAVALGVVCLALAMAAAPALADGDARKATPAEKAFYSRVVTAAAAALPAPPAGWEVVDQTEAAPPEYVATGTEEHPYSVLYDVEWLNAPGRDKMDADREKQMLGAAKGMDLDGEDQALMQKIEELATAAAAAAERGDWAESQRIQERMEPLAEAANNRMEAKNAGLDQILAETAVDDIGAMISVVVNQFNFGLADNTQRLTGRQGLSLAFREPREEPYTGKLSEQAITTILLGPGWVKLRDGDMEYYAAPEPTGGAHTRIYTVVVEIQAAEKRADAIIAAVDWAKLQALLAR